VFFSTVCESGEIYAREEKNTGGGKTFRPRGREESPYRILEAVCGIISKKTIKSKLKAM
jgi:hypothetical protein